MANNAKNKVISIVLCLVMILLPLMQSSMYVFAEDNTPSASITVAPSEDVYVSDLENAVLTAEPDGAGDLQWQIYSAEHDMWINIYGETGEECTLTYAKIYNMLDEDDTTKVRCVLNTSSGAVASEAVKVTAEEVGEMPAMATFGLRTAAEEPVEAAADEPAVADAGEELTNYSIVINYVFADGKQAANPWTATVAAGSDYNGTVKSPVVVGYAPDYAEYTVNVSGISKPETYTVTYFPAEVNFTVKHYQQNVNNDEYTLVEEETKTDFTEDPVGEGLEKSYDGFYALLYSPDTEIAADGSTVVELYYDRYYYLMRFDVDGGYGAEPIYARYGADVSAEEPTRAGYSFAGWKDVETGTVYKVAEFPYETMPAKNTEFVAQWTAQDVTYDVVFWYENADDEHYSQAGVLNDQTAKAGSTVNGATFKDVNFTGKDASHFTYSHADQNVEVKGDGSTVVNVYYSRNEYTLTFNMGNWANNCTVEQHQHGEACSELICTIEVHDHQAEDCELGECSHKQHTVDCYSGRYGEDLEQINKPDYSLTPLGNGIYSYYYGYRYCVNIGDYWYQSEYGRNNEIVFACLHVHNDGCYTCGDVAHTHANNCYESTCNLNEHYHSGNTCYLVVTAKYDADITSIWESNPVKGVIDNGYVFESSATGDFYSFLEKMPDGNITMTKSSFDGNSKYTWYYYLEVLPGTDTTDTTKTFRTDNGKTYELYHTSSVNASNLNLTYAEDYFPITGFTQRDSDVPSFSNRTAYLYYVRNSYDLTFSNNGTVVAGKGGSYLYQADISGTNFTPDYPEDLEPGAYTFDGWYESPFFGDTKFEFTSEDEDGNVVKATMPAKDVTLYACWVPVEHEVKLYPTKADMEARTNQIGTTEVVDHGSVATEPTEPTRGEYVFVGWFYMDGETEKAFDFSMPVNQDLDLYAKWSSNTLMDYTIRYAVENEDGTLTYIAEDTTGSALAGTTKTFTAKTGDDLFDKSSEGGENYQVGYFPETNSHSLTIDIEDPSKNEFTFIYVPKEKLPYKVLYLEYDGDYVYDGTEKVLHNEKNAETRDAVVTETFEPVTGYMPDAYQKRLVLSADETQNVIIFWYAKDDVHAPVQIIHYVQNAEGDGYAEYQSSTDLNGVIGQSYSTDVLTITGFDYDHATANEETVTAANGKVTGTVTANGLILELYYNRELHPYEFRFLEQGTDKVLADAVTGTARYGSQVTQNAKNIDGYTCVSDNAQSIIIQLEDGTTAVKNVRTFYYTEDEVTIDYVAVGPEGATDFGSVNPTSETVKVLTGVAEGSTATSDDNYHFVGWYDNAECEGKAISTEAKFVPTKAEDAKWVDGTTYYAKFEENEVTINYVAVGPEGATNFGNVDPTAETLKVVTGEATGSTAIAADNYTFVGWYDNAECEGKAISTEAKFVPTKAEDAKWVDGTTYYAKFEENEVIINYVAVGPEGATDFGSVTPKSETVKVLTDDAQGSTAKAADKFKFVGWYDNAECTGVALSTDANYVPAKVDGKNVAATYYAKFEYDVADLIIEKTAAEGTTIEDGQIFVFNVKGVDDRNKNIDMTVTITWDAESENSVVIKDLLVGEYTVTEDADWSWRYEPVDGTKNCTISTDGENRVTFANQLENSKWLDAVTMVENLFTGVSK